MDERRTAAIFKAFCDENRIRIITVSYTHLDVYKRQGQRGGSRRREAHKNSRFAAQPYKLSLIHIFLEAVRYKW